LDEYFSPSFHQNISVESGGTLHATSVRITFSHPIDNGALILGYCVECRLHPNYTKDRDGNEIEITNHQNQLISKWWKIVFEGRSNECFHLIPLQTYTLHLQYRIRSKNKVGYSNFSRMVETIIEPTCELHYSDSIVNEEIIPTSAGDGRSILSSKGQMFSRYPPSSSYETKDMHHLTGNIQSSPIKQGTPLLPPKEDLIGISTEHSFGLASPFISKTTQIDLLRESIHRSQQQQPTFYSSSSTMNDIPEQTLEMFIEKDVGNRRLLKVSFSTQDLVESNQEEKLEEEEKKELELQSPLEVMREKRKRRQKIRSKMLENIIF